MKVGVAHQVSEESGRRNRGDAGSALVRELLCPFAMRLPVLLFWGALLLGCGSTSGRPDGGGGTGAGTAGRGGGAGGQGGVADGSTTDGPSSHDGAGGLGGPCWTSTDCTNSDVCAAPGQVICGGICLDTPTCTTDLDCATLDAAWKGPSICDPLVCGCPVGGKGCQVGCSGDTDCALGTSCGSDHRCAPTVCTSASGSCPVDFTCAASGLCARKTCTLDTECSKACVLGACYGSPGTCHGISF
jgi:hypothetical protein